MMCDFFGVSRSGYYAWRSRGPSRRQQENAELVDVIKNTHAGSMGTYGSPRNTQTLQQQSSDICRRLNMRQWQRNMKPCLLVWGKILIRYAARVLPLALDQQEKIYEQ